MPSLFVSLLLSAAVCPADDLAACKAACAKKQAESCHNLAALQLKSDPALARVSFKKACDLGIAQSCSWAGRVAEKAGETAKAVPLYERGCKLKHFGGCVQLGKIFHDGLGVAKNLTKSASFFTKGCELGDTGSCMSLGLMEIAGEGMPKNPVKAERRFTAACEAGLAQACTELGVSEFSGELGRPANKAAAGKWWRRACDLKDAKACGLLEKVQPGAAAGAGR